MKKIIIYAGIKKFLFCVNEQTFGHFPHHNNPEIEQNKIDLSDAARQLEQQAYSCASVVSPVPTLLPTLH